eukprot:TRINITY_DN3305_c0_g1_i4.p2 TRINITY_DN3305_c0_g1~~TRINITY_DN3305_c0_g1_i4.p2  ORF type:complete len:239 (+),score=79.51 TRINITY_DN3305_c0_g1_i4:69-785(+)
MDREEDEVDASMDQIYSPEMREKMFDASNNGNYHKNKLNMNKNISGNNGYGSGFKGKEKEGEDGGEDLFTLSFRDVSYSIKKKRKWFGKNDGGEKYQQILNKVSGIVTPGQSLAIMGSTGSGKTTLLDILACREKQGKVLGEILINGIDAQKNLKILRKDIGYVTQDDYLLGTATVRETLRFVADLRLPNIYSSKEKDELVKKTLRVLGIYHIADSKVGSQFDRGVSGGEKKTRCHWL